jgi:hypothetical protein
VCWLHCTGNWSLVGVVSRLTLLSGIKKKRYCLGFSVTREMSPDNGNSDYWWAFFIEKGTRFAHAILLIFIANTNTFQESMRSTDPHCNFGLPQIINNEKPWRFNHIPPPFGAWLFPHPTPTLTLLLTNTWDLKATQAQSSLLLCLWRWYGAFGGSLHTNLSIALSHKQLPLSSLTILWIVALVWYVLVDCGILSSLLLTKLIIYCFFQSHSLGARILFISS